MGTNINENPEIINESESTRRQFIFQKNLDYEKLSLYQLIKADALEYGKWFSAIITVGFYVVLTYRLCHYFYKKKLGWLVRPLQFIAVIFTFCNINRKAIIGPGLVLEHPTCVYIGPHVSMGRGCRLGPRTFISCDFHSENPARYPVISDWINIAVGGVVMGPVTIGDDVVVGPNVVVLKDIPDKNNVMNYPPKAFLRTVDPWK